MIDTYIVTGMTCNKSYTPFINALESLKQSVFECLIKINN